MTDQRHRITQLVTVLSYQTLAMGLMILGASVISEWSAPANAAVETAAAPECSPNDGVHSASSLPANFLDLTVSWVLD